MFLLASGADVKTKNNRLLLAKRHSYIAKTLLANKGGRERGKQPWPHAFKNSGVKKEQ